MMKRRYKCNQYWLVNWRKVYRSPRYSTRCRLSTNRPWPCFLFRSSVWTNCGSGNAFQSLSRRRTKTKSR